MHIQEGTNTTLTTCTKMTEEVDRRHGVNGNSSSKGAGEDAPVNSSALAATGGRLKFFKDGKFILELVRGCAREGERAGWVSVPRKTFWPPAAAPPTPPAPPHASLSVSDDNSSVQSSPWQRDHCWKQTAPRRNISKELVMYYCRPSTLASAAIDAASRLKRRRPYDTAHLDPALNGAARRLTNGVCDKRNGDAGSPDDRARGEDAVDGARPKADDDRWADYDREKYYHMKLKKPYQYRKLRVYKKTRSALRRKELTKMVNKLRERLPSLPAPVNAKLASCRQEHAMVSPRKRILRELERVSLEDQGGKRRAKTAPALSTASYPPSPGPGPGPGPSHAPAPAPKPAHNGAPRKEPPVTKNVSSYSIHSLLSMPDASPAKTESPGAAASPDLSPSPDGYRYRYGSVRDSPTPPELRYRALAPYRWRDVPYVYPYAYHAPLYRPPPPLWLHYPPPGPWPPLAVPLPSDHMPKDEHTSDLPLNLSKH